MNGAISAAEANREFSSVLRRVRKGQSFVVTSHGRPVARIVPFEAGSAVSGTARAALFRRLEASPVQDVGEWSREELYDRRSE